LEERLAGEVAAGGPEALLASLDAELRSRRVRLMRLTHPM